VYHDATLLLMGEAIETANAATEAETTSAISAHDTCL
jgi:hypothetical protein